MGAAAATIEVERLEGLWSAKGGGGDGLRRVMSESGRGEGVSPAGGNKRVAKKAAELAQLVGQPQSNGAEAAAAELCKILEVRHERDLHAARTGGALTSLVALAVANCDHVAEPPTRLQLRSGASAPEPRLSTQAAAVRALLAACALPCNRAYLLLANHAATLAHLALPAATAQLVSMEAGGRLDDSTAEGADPEVTETLLLPLLKLLRLIVATPDSLLPSEAARKLRADLVGLLLTSGGLHDLQRVCMTSTATLERASGAAPLLLQFVALLHALLLPLRANKAAACAAPLKAFLDESALCGVPELLVAVLYPAVTGSSPGMGSSRNVVAAAAAASPPPQLSQQTLDVCRSAVQVRAAMSGGGSPNPHHPRPPHIPSTDPISLHRPHISPRYSSSCTWRPSTAPWSAACSAPASSRATSRTSPT